MIQFNLTNTSNQASNPPPPLRSGTDLPILAVLKEAYLLWHTFLPHLPRLTRYTLGVKIDALFIEVIEISLTAQYTKREEKFAFLNTLSKKFDNLKFFITLLWEAKGIDANKFSQISQKMVDIGKMLGGWIIQLKKDTLPA